jgi:predicted permease
VSGNGITRPANGTSSEKDHQSRRDVAVARDLLVLRVMGNVWNDLRFSLRMMARQPGFTAILVITLALGIGATTTIFSVVNSVVIKPLPYKDPDQLVRVYTEFLGQMQLKRFWISPPEYNDLRTQCKSCASVAAIGRGTASLSGGDRPVRVDAAFTSYTLADTLGVQPMLGRFYNAEEDRVGDPTQTDPPVVVLSYGLWRSSFGADPGVIGKHITLDAMPVTIIGVMPPGFDYPGGGIEAWAPYGIDPNSERRGSHGLEVTVRLKKGVSIEQFRGELDGLMAAWGSVKGAGKDVHAIQKGAHPMVAYPLKGEVLGSLATTLWLLQGAVLLVLLIAIANVTNLLLARAEARSREIAVRHAVGAGRGRLVQQLVTEAMTLGLVGGALGVLVAVWSLDATVALIPKSAPRVHEIRLDTAALVFALGASLVSSLLFGLAPILHTHRTDLHGALKDGTKSATGSRGRLRVRRALVIAEIALAMVLVIGCGLMVKSFTRLQHVDLGFKPDRLLTFEIELPQKTYPDVASAHGFYRRTLERMRALPGVEAVTLLDGLPPYRPINANDLSFPDKTPPPKGGLVWNTDYWQVVADDGIEMLGMKIVKGRDISRNDEDPIGQRVQVAPWGDKPPTQTIVGVVANSKHAGIDRPSGTEAYMPLWQGPEIWSGGGTLEPERSTYVMIRTKGDPAAMAPAAQRTLRDLDPTLAASKLRTMDGVLWEAVARPRFIMFLLGEFALLALALAAIGIYGVMSYSVAQRTHELGIRAALGARPEQLRAMVLRQGATIVAIGVGVGLVAAFALQTVLDRALKSVLYGASIADPLLFVLVTAAVVGAAFFATWIPARRATRVPPTVALRSE